MLTTSEYGAVLQKGQDKSICLTFKVSPQKKHLESLYLLLPGSFAKQIIQPAIKIITNLANNKARRLKTLPFSKIELPAKLEQLCYINMQELECLQFSVLKLLTATDTSCFPEVSILF